jgi:hypothetical protein
MMKRVSQLDAERAALIKQISRAFDATLKAVGDAVHMGGEGTGFAAGVRGPGRAARVRRRPKVSAIARKAISGGQKKRRAKRKAGRN